MKKGTVVGVLALVAGLAWGEVDWSRLPWIGDGRPVMEEAAWYAPDPSPVFTASFVLPKRADGRAVSSDGLKVHIACLGFYQVEINGARLKGLTYPDALYKTEFPLWSDYTQSIYADTHVVDHPDFRYHCCLPYPATNTITVALGNGWYNMPPLRFWGHHCFRTTLAHGRPCFKLAIDGVEKLDWTWRESSVVQNSLQLGAVVDRTRKLDPTQHPAVVVKGEAGKIRERLAPPVRPCAQIISGKATWLKEGEVQVVDFGVNCSGLPRFLLPGTKKGDRIEFVYGERLWKDGRVNPLTQTAGQIKRGNGGPGAPRVAEQKDVLIAGGADAQGVEGYRPPFTWHICRYVEVRGLKTLLAPGQVLFWPISSLLYESRSDRWKWKPKNADLARLHEVCRRTFRSNLVGTSTDCPGRERLCYGGDIVPTCESMILNWDMREFYLKTIQDFADAAAEDGWLTETAPYVGIRDRGFGKRGGPIAWTVVVPVLMEALIRHYPDVKDRALAFYPVCTRYIGLVDALHPTGIIPHDIGDHEALERAPDDVTGTAHWYLFVKLTRDFARMLGKTEDAVKYDALATKIATAFQTKYIKNGVVANGTQSAQAQALYLGLVPADQIPAAEARLVRAIEEKGYAPTTGIFSTRYLLMYLSEHGRLDLAKKVVFHKGFPGWFHMLDRGATTLWETWKESDNTYSNCHSMFGSVDEWLIRFGDQ